MITDAAIAILTAALSQARITLVSEAAGIAVSQLMLAVGQVSQVWSRACAIPPILRRLEPIMAEPREVPAGARPPGRLTGAIELDRVTFRYPASTAVTLNEVSISARPGELVAVVGRSGAGKSTLIRLLLGFERPAAGQVRTTVDGALKLYIRDPSAAPLTWQGDAEMADALAEVKAILG